MNVKGMIIDDERQNLVLEAKMSMSIILFLVELLRKMTVWEEDLRKTGKFDGKSLYYGHLWKCTAIL